MTGSYLACYVNDGRIDAAVGLNRAKDVRRVMPLIRARHKVDLAQLGDEGVAHGTLPLMMGLGLSRTLPVTQYDFGPMEVVVPSVGRDFETKESISE
ncbi:MAG: oxidoreductase C-terminal domain-containing protein [Vicinamibacterales bacterium]